MKVNFIPLGVGVRGFSPAAVTPPPDTGPGPGPGTGPGPGPGIIIPIIGILIGLLPIAPLLLAPPSQPPAVAEAPTPIASPGAAPVPAEVPAAAVPPGAAQPAPVPAGLPPAAVSSAQPAAQQPAVKPVVVLPAARTQARAYARTGPVTLPRGGADLWIPLAAGLALVSTGLLRRFPGVWATSVHVLGPDRAPRVFAASIACGVLVLATPGLWIVGTGWTVNSAQARALASWDGKVLRTVGAAVEGRSAERMVLSIPSLGLRRVVASDSTPDDLKSYGVGWIPWTALPAADGVVGIAGHRTTYGAPFFRLDRLSEGDAIVIEYRGNRYVYRVERSQTVGPTQVEILQTARDRRRVALVTCTPAYSAASRLVILGRLETITASNYNQ